MSPSISTLIATLQNAPDFPSLEKIGSLGHQVLWVSFAILAMSSIGIFALAVREEPKKRVFHTIGFLMTITNTMAYYAMASGLGTFYVGHTHIRQVFWIRFFQWAMTMPMVLLALSLLAGLPAVEIGLILIADAGALTNGIIWAVTIHTKARWGFMVFDVLFLVYVLCALLFAGRRSAYLRADPVGNAFIRITAYTILLWVGKSRLLPLLLWVTPTDTSFPAYSLVAVLQLKPDHETLLLAIVDLFAVPVWAVWLWLIHERTSEAQVSYPDLWVEGHGRLVLAE